jgi:hypothetical protein
LAAHEIVELFGERIPAVFALPVVGQRPRSRLNKVARLVLEGDTERVSVNE